ncbi:MAG: hypothetical protein WCI79_02160 [Candidatus Saccharibacteria bacterium]
MKEVEIGSSLFERLRKKCSEQHGRASEFNDMMHWGFDMGSIPVEPDRFDPITKSEIPVLAIYLPGRRLNHPKFALYGFTVTFNAQWNLITAPEGYKKHRDKSVDSHHYNMELVSRLAHTHQSGTMVWVGYDINANRNISPEQCWRCPIIDSDVGEIYPAHSENLSALLLEPELVENMDGVDVAHPNCSGYKITGGIDGGPKEHVPYIHCCENDKILKLDATYAGLPFKDFSSPTARKLY